MSLKIRMLLLNQFENLMGTLSIARDELNTAKIRSKTLDYRPDCIENKLSKEYFSELESIDINISFAQKRIKEFEAKTIKELEKRHKEKIRRLKIRRKIISAQA